MLFSRLRPEAPSPIGAVSNYSPYPEAVSSSKEERTSVADGTAEPAAAAEPATVESEAVEPKASASPPETEVEMTAAEALARATEAAAGPPAKGSPAVEEAEVAPAADDTPEADGLETATADAATEEVTTEEAATAETATVETATAEAAADEAATDDGESEPPTVEASPDTAEASTAETAPEAPGPESPEEAAIEKAEAGEDAPEAEAAETAGEEPAAEAATEAAETAAQKEKPAPAKPVAPPQPERPELRAVREALESRQPIEGRVISWNQGGFHLALGELSAFCPRSEMEIGEVEEPESYLDRTFEFRVLRLQGKRKRIVVSRAAHLRNEKSRQRNALRKKLKPGTELDGTVASLKDFGAFIDLGGAQGLVHVSEISHRRVEHPSHVLSEGQEVRVKVIKVEQGGRRISLSIRALEPDPWKDLADRFPQGAVVKGTVEKANQIGAFIELAPGLTGLLPARSMSIPRETTPARAYPPGKEVSVQIVSVDPRRQRIGLALEGSGLEGSRTDYKDYQRQAREERDGDGFNALASAFRRLQGDAD